MTHHTHCDTCGREDISLMSGIHQHLFCQWCGSTERIYPGETVSQSIQIIDVGVPCPACATKMTKIPIRADYTLWKCPACSLQFYYGETYDETLRDLPEGVVADV